MSGFVRLDFEFRDFTDPVSGVTFPGILNTNPNSSKKFEQLEGSGFFIGDNLVLTAGHNLYKFNRAPDPAKWAVLTAHQLTPSALDTRGYFDLYEAAVDALGTSNSPPLAGRIEARSTLRIADTVFIERNGTVESDDAGIIVFLDRNDIVSPDYGLNDDTDDIKVVRRGVRTGEVKDVAITPVGAFFTEPFLILGDIFGENSDGDNTFAGPGDSGAAVRVQFEKDHPYNFNTQRRQEFILGNLHSITVRNGRTDIRARGEGRANYFTKSEFDQINTFLENAVNNSGLRIQTGNVTDDEPTNLIVGSSGADGSDGAAIDGSFRADIVLGRGDDDFLNDGDSPFATVYADDQLFGGEGNDTLIVGDGNNLIHGGDFRGYGGQARTPLAMMDMTCRRRRNGLGFGFSADRKLLSGLSST